MTLKLIPIIYRMYFLMIHPIASAKIIFQIASAKQVETKKDLAYEPFVSIILVTFNADEYVKKCIKSLKETKYKNKEIIIVDNKSNPKLRSYLKRQKSLREIDKLYLSPENTYFSGGVNLGLSETSKKSEFVVLINSDVEIIKPDWLKILISNSPEGGIISFGRLEIPVLRPDGWCFCINTKIIRKMGGLNEYYKMDWAITELTARVLRGGYKVKCIANPESYVYHFGQKSRPKKKNSMQFNKMSFQEVFNIFGNKQVELLKV